MKHVLKPVLIILKQSTISGLFYVLLSVINGLFAPLLIYANQYFIDTIWDYVNIGGEISEVFVACTIFAATILFPTVLSMLKTLATNRIEWNLCKNFDAELMRKKMNIKYEHLEDKDVQLMIKKMREPKWAVFESFTSFCAIGRSFVALVGIMVFFTQVNYVATIILAVLFIFILIVNIAEQNRNIKQLWWEAEDRRLMETYYWMFENSGFQQEIRTFTNDEYLLGKYDNQTKKLNKIKLKVSLKNAIGDFCIKILEVGFFTYVLFISIYGMIDGLFTIGVVSAALTAIGSYISSSNMIARNFAFITKFKQETKYYDEFMAIPNRDKGTELLPKNCKIVFKNVCFTYPKTEKEILKNLNLTFDPKKKIAIVGENGSGKSTMIKLLAGLYKPTSGIITVGGIDIDKLSDEARFELFGFIFQDVNFYSVLLRESIGVGGAEKINDDEALVSALKSANAEGLLKKADNNLDMMLGYRNEQGITFSGGEQQKLQISRVFLMPHKFVVLDEPVASLDANSESRMYESFLKHFDNCGAIVISHRLASAKMADEIILLEKGEIVAVGSHAELMAKSKLYNTMFTLQASQYVSDEELGMKEVKIERKNRKKV